MNEKMLDVKDLITAVDKEIRHSSDCYSLWIKG